MSVDAAPQRFDTPLNARVTEDVSWGTPENSRVDLYWLPLGAGGHSVRWNGRVYEFIVSRMERRMACDLYHSALEIAVPNGRFVIEMTPVADADGALRGVVGEGPVGARLAERLRIFRYELRRWPNGVIPDLEEAVDSPVRLSDDEAVARRILELVPAVPALVWGRDERGAGEMWNSNSVVAWLITAAGLDAGAIRPPDGGRAPGWNAGCVVARRANSAPGPARAPNRRSIAERQGATP